ncbi:MAG: glucose-6-phosphate isomerase, partial [Burkholderiales bacterium]
MSPLTKTKSWRQLRAHQTEIAQKSLREQFAEDPRRFDCFSLEACGLLLDYSKNLITEETLRLLFSLAHERQLEQWRERLFAAKRINFTENRAVLHWALRASRKVAFEGRDVTIGIARVREHMRRFSD